MEQEREASERITEALRDFGRKPGRIPRSATLDIPEDVIFDVVCDCGYFGVRDDCYGGWCPNNCGERVRRVTE